MIVTPAEMRASSGLAAEVREHPGRHVERRFHTGAVEARADSGVLAIRGLAAVFNSLSENLGGFKEMIAPGAFSDVLAQNPDVRALVNHNPDLVLARTASGTLDLAQVDEGLQYDIEEVADTSYGRDLGVLLGRGDVSQSSFAFRVARDGVEWTEDEDTGLPLRIIRKFAGLYDVSPVTYPAYPSATVGSRREDPAAAHEAARASLALRQRRARQRARS